MLILFFTMTFFFLFEIKQRSNVWYKNPERIFHKVKSFHSQRSKISFVGSEYILKCFKPSFINRETFLNILTWLAATNLSKFLFDF